MRLSVRCLRSIRVLLFIVLVLLLDVVVTATLLAVRPPIATVIRARRSRTSHVAVFAHRRVLRIDSRLGGTASEVIVVLVLLRFRRLFDPCHRHRRSTTVARVTVSLCAICGSRVDARWLIRAGSFEVELRNSIPVGRSGMMALLLLRRWRVLLLLFLLRLVLRSLLGSSRRATLLLLLEGWRLVSRRERSASVQLALRFGDSPRRRSSAR